MLVYLHCLKLEKRIGNSFFVVETYDLLREDRLGTRITIFFIFCDISEDHTSYFGFFFIHKIRNLTVFKIFE